MLIRIPTRNTANRQTRKRNVPYLEIVLPDGRVLHVDQNGDDFQITDQDGKVYLSLPVSASAKKEDQEKYEAEKADALNLG